MPGVTGEPAHSCLGILAGGGVLAREIAEASRARGRPVHIVALKGEADDAFEGFPVTWAGWGEIGGILSAFERASCRDIVIVGRVKRPDLKRLRPDIGFVRHCPALLKIIRSGGDDSVLRRVIGFVEAQGLSVVGVPDVAPELVIGEGVLGKRPVDEAEATDIRLGLAVLSALGRSDIGQSVVVAGGRIAAVEGAEGTDAMLKRVAAGASGRGVGGVLVKRAKPGQELRVDLPAIGPETVRNAHAAGLSGITVEAHRVLAASRGALVAAADRAGLFIAGVTAEGEAAPPAMRTEPRHMRAAGRRKIGRKDHGDIAKGAAVLGLAGEFGIGAGAIVTRRHVLAVEANEGLASIIARAHSLRQWGRRRRLGALVVAEASDLSPDLVGETAAAGLAGIAVAGESSLLPADVIAAADAAGLFLAVPEAGT